MPFLLEVASATMVLGESASLFISSSIEVSPPTLEGQSGFNHPPPRILDALVRAMVPNLIETIWHLIAGLSAEEIVEVIPLFSK